METIRYCLLPADEQYAEQYISSFSLSERCNLVYDDRTPEICLISSWRCRNGKINKEILRNWRRYSRHPVTALIWGEAPTPDHSWVDFCFSCSPHSGKNCFYHNAIRFVQFASLLPGAARDAKRERLLRTSKTRFCNFIYTNDELPQTRVRRDFCKLLTQYKRVDCPGRSLNNTQLTTPRSFNNKDEREKKLCFMASCKFSIAFENTSQSYYLTEKLWHALYAGSVPIYWGCPEAAEYYNPAAFINCHDYPDFEAVVQRVIEIDGNPGLYEEYRNAPPVLPESRFFQDRRKQAEFCSVMIDEALRRRTQKTKILRAYLRLCRFLFHLLQVHALYRIRCYFRYARKYCTGTALTKKNRCGSIV